MAAPSPPPTPPASFSPPPGLPPLPPRAKDKKKAPLTTPQLPSALLRWRQAVLSVQLSLRAGKELARAAGECGDSGTASRLYQRAAALACGYEESCADRGTAEPHKPVFHVMPARGGAARAGACSRGTTAATAFLTARPWRPSAARRPHPAAPPRPMPRRRPLPIRGALAPPRPLTPPPLFSLQRG